MSATDDDHRAPALDASAMGGAQAYSPPTPVLPHAEPSMAAVPKVQLAESALPARASDPALPFAPRVMGQAPQPASFAPQVMGQPPHAAPFAPQVMGPAPQAAAFAPSQPMPSAAFAPQVMPTPSPGAHPATEHAAHAAFSGATPGTNPPPASPWQAEAPVIPVPSALPFVPGPTPSQPSQHAAPAPGAAEPRADDGLAASPWNAQSQGGFDRAMLPSATAPRPIRSDVPPPHEKAQPPVDAGSSRGPWIVVGALIVIAVIGSVVVYRTSTRRSSSEPIAIPAGSAPAEEPEAQPYASAAPSATAAPAPRPVIKRKAFLDDPYADVPTAPSRKTKTGGGGPAGTGSPHRVFDVEN